MKLQSRPSNLARLRDRAFVRNAVQKGRAIRQQLASKPAVANWDWERYAVVRRP